MDAGAVPKLPAKGNRFWRLPLSGRVIDGKRCKYRSGLHIVAESRDVDAVLRDLDRSSGRTRDWTLRVNPKEDAVRPNV